MSIVIEGLSKVYGTQKALDGISFGVQAGEIVGFLGPNGAGKSTTMKIITGYLPPSQGTVKVCDLDVSTQSLAARRCIGYLPEHNPLYLDMYVREYLAFIGNLHGLGGRALTQRVKELVALCGLEREQKKKIAALSKGFRQRVGLAQALLPDPPVLILDEPTTGLDPNQVVEIRQLIREAGRSKTVIFSTHIMQEVQAVCDRAIIINLGKIVADSPVAQLGELAQTETVIQVEFDAPIAVEILRQIAEIKSINALSATHYEIRTDAQRDIRPDISRLAAAQGWGLLGLQQQTVSLENVFQRLTNAE